MSIVLNLLKDLYNTELRYKGVGVNIFGIPTFLTGNKKSCKSALSRMRKNGYVENKDGNWRITGKGTKYMNERTEMLHQFDSPFTSKSPKNLIVFFDIPENSKNKRDWLRWHLKKFNYEMIQRSVWIGPSPLPKDFVNYLKSIKLHKYLKTYKTPVKK